MGSTTGLTTLSLVGLYLFQAFVGTQGDAHLLQQTCSKTLDPGFCLAALHSDPGSLTADLAGLAAISIKLVAKNATHTLSTIGNLQKKQSFDNFAQACLRDCHEFYSDSIDDLNEAVDNLKSGEYDDVDANVSSAQTNSATCEDQFGDQPGHVSPLTKENQFLEKLGSVSLAILKLVTKNQKERF